ncbi:type II secretion system protein GspL [Xylophilus sp.]|uniref:type II secretion system protein GspL n=1 Tax=Xylophilus sp. TaxID=2653893 RepID=UPI0013B6CA1D|nr:type II secretion system protein GspL [Xylophilus sp.]KAF1049817.1 MAG: hypothetical protein GAK38_00480 [Xylophilus sp.]
MSTLIVLLPPGPAAGASADHPFVLTADGHAVVQHGSAPPALLPLPTGTGAATVAVVPARLLSWHRVDLPRGVNQARLRPVLEGLLEDRLLDDPAALQFALAPGAHSIARSGGPAWVAVCDRAWLRGALAALEAAGRPVARIVPEFAPQPDPGLSSRVHAIDGGGGADDVWLVHEGDAEAGVALLPLLAAAAVPLRAADDITAEPAVAAVAERVLGRSLPLRTAGERWLAAARGGWDLAQFDLARPGGRRLWRRIGAAAAQFLRAPEWRAARWGAALLVVVQIAGLNLWAWQERSALAAKRARIEDTLTETFPQVRVVLDAPVQMEREVAALRQATGGISPGDLESMLAALAAALPAGRSVAAIEYSPGEARLRGPGLESGLDSGIAARLRQAGYSLRTDGSTVVLRADAAAAESTHP